MALRYLLVIQVLTIMISFTDAIEDQQINSNGSGSGQLQTLCKAIINDIVAPDNLNITFGNASTCEDDCRQKYTPTDGTVHSFYSWLDGWVLNISCNHGYELEGRASIICYEDIGTEEFPVCEKQDHTLAIFIGVCGVTSFLLITFVFITIHKGKQLVERSLNRMPKVREDTECHIGNDENEENSKFIVEEKTVGFRTSHRKYYYKPVLKMNKVVSPCTNIGVVSPLRGHNDHHDDNAGQHVIGSVQSDNALPMLRPDSIEYVTTLRAADAHTNEDERDNEREDVTLLRAANDHTNADERDNDQQGYASVQLDQSGRGQELSVRGPVDTSNISRLNWNMLFCELSSQCCGRNWRMFAIDLVGAYTTDDEDLDTIIDGIEEDTRRKGGTTTIVLYKIFRRWKTYSKTGSLSEIETALKHSHHEDVIRFMKNNMDKFYKPYELIDQHTTLKIQDLSDIPALKYQVTPNRPAYEVHTCFDDNGRSVENGPLIEEPDQDVNSNRTSAPIVPYHQPSAEFEPYNNIPRAGFIHTERFRIPRGKQWNKRNGKHGNHSPQQMPSHIKVIQRTRHAAKKTTKVRPSKKKSTFKGTTVESFSKKDNMCIDLLLHLLEFDLQKILNVMEYTLLLQYTVLNLKKENSLLTLAMLSGISFDDYKSCQHVPMSKNGTLHIINSGDLTVTIKDELWKLVETYVHRARAEVVSRVQNSERHLFLLTYEGKKVTHDYIHMEDTTTTEAELTQNNCRRSIELDTEDNNMDCNTTTGDELILDHGRRSIAVGTEYKHVNGTTTTRDEFVLDNGRRTIAVELALDNGRRSIAVGTENKYMNGTATTGDELALDNGRRSIAVYTENKYMNGTTTTKEDSTLDHGRRSIAVGTENMQASTSKAKNRKVAVCDCKRRLPKSRNTTHAKRPNKVRLDTGNDEQHKRRFFCGKQIVTIEKLFKKEIRRGKVIENTVHTKFDDCAELREAFNIHPNDVSKILVKKVTDRVRCFIRNKNKKNTCLSFCTKTLQHNDLNF